MNEASRLKAVIAGSYIIHLVSLLDKSELTKKSSIELVQWITRKRSSTGIKNTNAVRSIADKVWQDASNVFIDEHLKISVPTVVETIMYNFEPELVAMYGQELIVRANRFVDKQHHDKTSDYAADSYRFADTLRDCLRKGIFEFMKDIK